MCVQYSVIKSKASKQVRGKKAGSEIKMSLPYCVFVIH